jgi:hypothetical protein
MLIAKISEIIERYFTDCITDTLAIYKKVLLAFVFKKHNKTLGTLIQGETFFT